ncbi:protein FAM124A [Patella vulgata]|uniref:protein FAM124A n=1 Tax=Patella vulgata TaxID=6465 RepID=UPI00217F7246|nr:protein FAM124A [Patella vulgata]
MSSTRSETGSEEVSLYGSEPDNDEIEEPKLVVRINSNNKVHELCRIYYPVLELIEANRNILDIVPEFPTDNSVGEPEQTVPKDNNHYQTSLAVVIFLYEEGMLGCERIQGARGQFENPPWSFHHSEEMKRKTIHPYPYNSQEFYYTSDDLPLWAVRQVHYGNEHLRIMLFVSDVNWYDMLGFYKVILGLEPEVQHQEFCLYTLSSPQVRYDVQFALKRITGTIKPKHLNRVQLVFSVSDIGQMVPLFPHACQPVSDKEWTTVDHDGNKVVLNIKSYPTPDTSKQTPFIRNGPRTKTLNQNGFSI